MLYVFLFMAAGSNWWWYSRHRSVLSLTYGDQPKRFSHWGQQSIGYGVRSSGKSSEHVWLDRKHVFPCASLLTLNIYILTLASDISLYCIRGFHHQLTSIVNICMYLFSVECSRLLRWQVDLRMCVASSVHCQVLDLNYHQRWGYF